MKQSLMQNRTTQTAHASVNMQTSRPSEWLSLHAKNSDEPNYTSQRGEDRILRKIFELIGEGNRWCVEFGAADGKRGSNTWQFIEHKGWSAIFIEPKHDSELSLRNYRDTFEALERRYAGNEKVFCLNESVELTGSNSLAAILAKTPIPKEFELLSIDVDSEDYRIWESLTEYRPKVVVIEHNKTIPIHIDFASNQGSSLRALARLGREKEYELVAATETNGIFVRQEYFDIFGIVDNDPIAIWPDYTNYQFFMWQLYDGTVVFQGSNKLRWVRGVDGTILGQIRGNKVIQNPPARLFSTIAPNTQSLVSGKIRAMIYSILDRL